MKKNLLKITLFLSFLFIFSNCGVLNKSAKYQFSDGYYSFKTQNSKLSKVYVDNSEDTINVYSLKKEGKFWEKDSLIYQHTLKSNTPLPKFVYTQKSFDVDILTILLKYRPPVDSFPRQLNTNLNGALFLGYRNDIYHLGYKKTPLKFNRNITHYAFAIGGFVGLGSTAVNPPVTRFNILNEYDGVVFNKGISLIIGIDNFTLGIAAGLDNLLDYNDKFWIYENKSWLGLSFGLNLN